MIKKFFELENINVNNSKVILLYGMNEGLKEEIILKLVKNSGKKLKKIFENEFIQSFESFEINLTNKSLFDEKEIFVINKVTDKSLKLIENLINKKIEDTSIILESGILEKKSKLRNYFEKSKNLICSAFYADNSKTLFDIAYKFFKKKNITISNESINIIVERAREDRKNLDIELKKIELFAYKNKKVDIEDVFKLTNLSENYGAFELADNCLIKNYKKTINILSENNYTSDDCILILRTLSLKSKRLLKLKEMLDNNTIESVISSYRPPIFWKEKEIVKKQIELWSKDQISEFVFSLNELELLIKKNLPISLKILYDFLLQTSKPAKS